MENQKEIKVAHFTHWSRSGITSLIKTIVKNNPANSSFILLDGDSEFLTFYHEIPEKVELKFSTSAFNAIIKYIRFVKKIRLILFIHTH